MWLGGFVVKVVVFVPLLGDGGRVLRWSKGLRLPLEDGLWISVGCDYSLEGPSVLGA